MPCQLLLAPACLACHLLLMPLPRHVNWVAQRSELCNGTARRGRWGVGGGHWRQGCGMRHWRLEEYSMLMQARRAHVHAWQQWHVNNAAVTQEARAYRDRPRAALSAQAFRRGQSGLTCSKKAALERAPPRLMGVPPRGVKNASDTPPAASTLGRGRTAALARCSSAAEGTWAGEDTLPNISPPASASSLVRPRLLLLPTATRSGAGEKPARLESGGGRNSNRPPVLTPWSGGRALVGALCEPNPTATRTLR